MNHRHKLIVWGWVGIVILLFCRIIVMEKMVTKSLFDFDEARYAEVAKNILRTNVWLIPLGGGPDEPRNFQYVSLENGEVLYPYFWKPPLSTILISLFFKLFGESEFLARFPALLFGIGCVGWIYLVSKQLFPENKYANYIAPILVISTNDFSVIASQALIETQLLFFALGTVYLANRNTNRSMMMAGIFFWITGSIETVYYLLGAGNGNSDVLSKVKVSTMIGFFELDH